MELHTERPHHATELASGASRDGADLVIVAGGDGTINEALAGLVGTGTPMAILPLGTANVLAHEVGIPVDVRRAMSIALEARPRPITLGRITLADGSTRHFCTMAGIGFDAAVVAGVNRALKKHTGKLAYIMSGLAELARWSPEALNVRMDSGEGFACYTLIVSNGRKYAGDFDICNDADIGSPELRLVPLRRPGRASLVSFALGVLGGSIARRESIAASRVEVSGNAHIQADGEYVGRCPAVIEAVPGAAMLVY